ncbi:hypothetical protein [Faucicola atlantae]|uniref:Uncharacterized protein n=1 Tax=Faucicola atlantae TaxID=34059 RepID=A0A1B8QBU7_9GAMM|nr:hypothetical protein [Moraxella atlantae]OBX77151.1 hypothetical protein A9306_09785 [Moraxella atlantae]
MSKYKSILIISSIVFLVTYFILTSKEVYYYCNNSNCISIVVSTKGKSTYFSVYDRIIYSRLFLNIYSHADYPADIPVGILRKESNNKKVVIISEGEPDIKGRLNKNIEFRTTLFIGDNKKDVVYYYDLKSLLVNNLLFNNNVLNNNLSKLGLTQNA